MKVHNDLTPKVNEKRLDPSHVLSHERHLHDLEQKLKDANGALRKGKTLAKTEGIPLDLIKFMKSMLKGTAQDNINRLNLLFEICRIYMIPGIDKLAFLSLPEETADEEAMLLDRFELGLLHGRQGLAVEFDMVDLTTPAGQEYMRGHNQGSEEFKHLQPLLMQKMDAPPAISPDDPAVAAPNDNEPADDPEDDVGNEEAAEEAPAPAKPPGKKRGRKSKAELAAIEAAKAAERAEPSPAILAEGEGFPMPEDDAPAIAGGEDDDFGAPAPVVDERPPIPV